MQMYFYFHKNYKETKWQELNKNSASLCFEKGNTYNIII